MMLVHKFKHEPALRVTRNRVLYMLVCCYRNSHHGMKTYSAQFLITVMHFRSLEGHGSSINYISADNAVGVA